MCVRKRDQRRQPPEKAERLQHQVGGSLRVRPRAAQPIGNLPVGPAAEAFLGEGSAQPIAAKSLQRLPVIRRHELRGVEREAEVTYQKYPWENKGEKTARMKIAACTYFEPWDWVIGTGAYRGEFDRAAMLVGKDIDGLIRFAIIVGLVTAAGMILCSLTLVNRQVRRPLARLSEAARALATGEVDVAVDGSSRDAVGEVARSIQAVAEASR